MNDKNANVRNTLKVAGPCLIGLGVVLIVFGVGDERRADERRNEQSREFMAGQRDIHDIDHGPPAGIFLIMGGTLAVVGGLACLGAAYQRALLRYQAREYGPVVKEALADVAPRLVGATGVKCPKCETDNAADAKFCKECGTGLGAKPCPRCKTANEAGAKFCKECGAGL